MDILDGRALAKRIRGKIKDRIQVLPQAPMLAVILVGDDPASHTYVGLKQKACEEVGIRFDLHHYDSGASEEALIEKIQEFNEDTSVTGILVQLPLPKQRADAVIAAIDPLKDVDGFHPVNLKRLREDKPAIASAVALGVMKLLDATETNLAGSQAALICSPLFAEPLEILLKERNISSAVTSPDDPHLEAITREAEIVISAVGRPRYLNASHIRDGAVVIDVGTTKVEGKIVGDVDAVSLKQKNGFLTPVPGGVGPMTVAMLMVNILKAFSLQHSRADFEENA